MLFLSNETTEAAPEANAIANVVVHHKKFLKRN
jgi:hypothetical protein